MHGQTDRYNEANERTSETFRCKRDQKIITTKKNKNALAAKNDKTL
jgi:hypothetical protein